MLIILLLNQKISSYKQLDVKNVYVCVVQLSSFEDIIHEHMYIYGFKIKIYMFK